MSLVDTLTDTFFQDKFPDGGLAPIRTQTALETQEGGSHYKNLAIQPVEYIHANNIGYFEGCVIKYVTRWRAKNGLEDLKKARHFIDLLLELESKNANQQKEALPRVEATRP